MFKESIKGTTDDSSRMINIIIATTVAGGVLLIIIVLLVKYKLKRASMLSTPVDVPLEASEAPQKSLLID